MIVIQRNGKVIDEFVEDSRGNLIPRKTQKRTSLSSVFYSFFQAVFLPEGYPESVSSDYASYQLWDTLQAFCSSITGALAMKAVLGGYGVGDETKSVMAAAITWLLKDGTSMCGRIGFAWWIASRLDSDAKQWRLFADVLNDAAIFLELVSQYFPREFFTPVVCVAGVGKAIVGVAGGATRAALTQHQAKCNNMADVSAKDGSQETMVNLAALVANLWLLPFVDDKHRLLWILFIIFTLLHVFSNFKAVSAVVMETLNLTRFFLVFTRFAETGFILSPEIANQRESVWRRDHNPTKSRFYVNFATSVDTIRRNRHVVTFSGLTKTFHGKNYLVCFSPASKKIDVLLQQGCRSIEELEALYFAAVTRLDLDNPSSSNLHLDIFVDADAASETEIIHYLDAIRNYVDDTFQGFKDALETAGWDLGSYHFDSKSFRFSLLPSGDSKHYD